MSDLSLDSSDNTFQPLAARMWPKNLAQYIGQQHLPATGKPLPHAIGAGHLYSMILWGPSGTGKTILAEAIARYVSANVGRTSAVTSGVKGICEAIEHARQNRSADRRTILLVNGVHRFNKSRQDASLPYIEDGTIIFIDATIENPSFELNSAPFSHAHVYLPKSLNTEDIKRVPTQTVEDEIHDHGDQGIVLPDETRYVIVGLVNGDTRQALNALEMMADMAEVDDSGKRVLKPELLIEIAGERSVHFDNKGDCLYDLISVLRKSVRGSAPDAALYRYVQIITAGGDSLYVARRCPVIASEGVDDTGPRAMQVATAAWDCFTHVGLTEGECAIVQAIVYLACAPESSTVHIAFKVAPADARERPDYDAPAHLRNAPTKSMKEMGYGQEYRYAHDEANAYAAGKVYFPSEITQTRYYFPTDGGLEGKIGEKLAWLIEQDQNNPIKRYRQRYRCDDAINISPRLQVVVTPPT